MELNPAGHGEPTSSSPRFTFIDALRGIAALWVATFHFYGGVSDLFRIHIFPQPLHGFFAHGNSGVEIFFVISGFVIAYSIRGKRITPGYFGQFMLRRSLRLEPPYWVTIALAIAMLWLSNHLRHDRVAALPSWQQILAHVFYLQGILHQGQIVDVFWTLCIEVQFYISLLLLVALAQRFGDSRLARLRVLLPLALVSLAIQSGLLPEPGPWMFKFWYLFQLGVMGYWATARLVRPVDFFAYSGLVAAVLGWHPSIPATIGLLTGVAIYLAGRFDRLTALNYAPLQYLGRRSYSIYLVHPVLGVPFTYFVAQHFFARPLSMGAAALCMAMAIVASLVTAEALYRLVEAPSLRLSRTLKRKAPAAA
jgi:peptidoglycan/LPS O-acetylase OafA/YrhL